MRVPKYLSNSSLQLWETDRREYYLRYLCDQRSPKIAQTRPMAVGSAFDGMVKNAIEKMCGMPIRDYMGQIEAAVGSAAQIQALKDGEEVLSFYRQASGIGRLLCTGIPRMEFSVEGPIPGTANCFGGPVILLGKPDMYYKIGGHNVVHDWKVNGFCSKASPQKGYVWDSKTRGCHKDVTPMVVDCGGAKVMIGRLEHFDWTDQLSSYGWLLGEALGDEFLMQVHQITRDSSGLRLTEHRVFADKASQLTLRDRYVRVWEAIHSGRCFDSLPLEEDIREQKNLDTMAAGLQDPIFNAVCGRE